MSRFSRNDDTTPEDGRSALLEDISGDYTIDANHSRLGFSARHAMVTSVRGHFNKFEGTAHIDTVDPANSHVTLTIQADTIDTGSADRDTHLTSPDFFDAANNPHFTFTSTRVERDGDEWDITGDLSIKGVVHPITIGFDFTGSAKDPYGNVLVGFEGVGVLNRKDWGLTWNAALETGGVLVSDKIKLAFDISLVRNA